MKSTEGVFYYVWADGSYHCEEDGEPPRWKSDDYSVVEITEAVEDLGYDDLDDYFYALVNEVNLGKNCEKSKIIT